ncbi:MAG: serine/threonine protein kinase [Sandaracinaceae bacterium]|nr:serine/threonine protein kinase [Sandaracinaceae bacterium]
MTQEASNQADLRVIEGEDQGQKDPLVGTTIDGRYFVERVLGEGGMGLVYLGKHIVLGKPLAVKVLRPDVSKDQEIITRFRQEAQSASSIGNQHIIDISDFGTLPDGSTYFVMEFLDGTDLSGAIEKAGQMPANRVVHVAKQLAQALGAAHENGIVHRDLKPDNVYLIKRGGDTDFVKVLDFGIAKVGGSNSKLTRAGQVFGTPHYMSPEQCSGSNVDHRTDIYAIGVMLYEMVTGDVPFDADNLMGILTKHLYEDPIPPTQKNANLPRELEAVILKAMSKQTETRYQNMGEFYDDLVRVGDGLPALAMADGTGAYSTRRTAPTVGAVTGAPTSGGSKTGIIVAVVGAVVLLAAGGGIFVAMNQPEPAPQPPIAVIPAPAPIPTPPVPEVVEAPPPVVEEFLISISSEPAGAAVWRGNELIGNTPLQLPRPTGDERLDLQLRLDGYDSKDFAISSLTRAESISFTLDRERSSSGRRPPSSSGSSSAASSGSNDSPPPAMTPSMRPSGSEVLDPWAN